MAKICMEKMEKPLSKLTFYAIYAMDFGHRITSVTPKLDILTCLFTHTRLLKAHTKHTEAHTEAHFCVQNDI